MDDASVFNSLFLMSCIFDSGTNVLTGTKMFFIEESLEELLPSSKSKLHYANIQIGSN